ncbi:hypothetical protein HS088_TW22G01231 [Tripterygium wilfordii]|uniref:Cupin type-1 domain-containing protein n=1 Tax=Tripterygium wilfordii TaxID=458696 RepID=A0A7J7C0S3_TRIWF|nr:hypothetical protein HS088_TW22G01231 [Tripterygium wilfordii]
MASKSFSFQIFVLLVASFAIVQMVKAGDADILSDFVVPPNTTIDGNFFTYIDMRALVNSKPPSTLTVAKASMAEFPALNGQSVSYATLQFPIGNANPPHTHPRSAELLFIVEGSLQVGFVDTTN